LQKGRSLRVGFALGQFGADQVFTPLTPCRIVDTLVSGAPIVANTTRTFDVDGSDFSAQGGFAGSCGVPFGVASAVVMAIIGNQPSATGQFVAWGLGTRSAGSPALPVLNDSVDTGWLEPGASHVGFPRQKNGMQSDFSAQL
jgi:hypothetical protein